MSANKKARLSSIAEQIEHVRQLLQNYSGNTDEQYEKLWFRMFEHLQNVDIENYESPWDFISAAHAAQIILWQQEQRVRETYNAAENNYFNPFAIACDEFKRARVLLEEKMHRRTVEDLFDASKSRQQVCDLHMRRKGQIAEQDGRETQCQQLRNTYVQYWREYVSRLKDQVDVVVQKTKSFNVFLDRVLDFVHENFPDIYDQVERRAFKEDVPTYIIICWTHFNL